MTLKYQLSLFRCDNAIKIDYTLINKPQLPAPAPTTIYNEYFDFDPALNITIDLFSMDADPAVDSFDHLITITGSNYINTAFDFFYQIFKIIVDDGGNEISKEQTDEFYYNCDGGTSTPPAG